MKKIFKKRLKTTKACWMIIIRHRNKLTRHENHYFNCYLHCSPCLRSFLIMLRSFLGNRQTGKKRQEHYIYYLDCYWHCSLCLRSFSGYVAEFLWDDRHTIYITLAVIGTVLFVWGVFSFMLRSFELVAGGTEHRVGTRQVVPWKSTVIKKNI